MFFQLQFPSKSPLLPDCSINLYRVKLDKKITKKLAEIILLEEPNILANTKPQNLNDPEWLTQRLWEYNFFDFNYVEVSYLRDWLKEQYVDYMRQTGLPIGKTYIQCWANKIINNGRNIVPHNHCDAHANAPCQYSYLSGNICIQAVDTKTYYASPFDMRMRIGIENQEGEMVFFPSYVMHWTDKNTSETPRLSLAFDIITEEVYNMIDNKSNYREFT